MEDKGGEVVCVDVLETGGVRGVEGVSRKKRAVWVGFPDDHTGLFTETVRRVGSCFGPKGDRTSGLGRSERGRKRQPTPWFRT